MYSRLTSARGRSAWGNQLSGAVPAALGALTDLELLRARPLASGGKARHGPLRRSVRSCARAVLRSGLGSNRLTGTIGSWISSLAKLAYLYAAPAHTVRVCGGGALVRRYCGG